MTFNLGQMQTAPAGEIAATMALLQRNDVLLAVLSMRANKMQTKGLSASSSIQAEQMKNSLEKQAEALMQDALQNTVSGGSTLLIQGYAGYKSYQYSSEIGELQNQIEVGEQYEDAIQQGLQQEPEPIVVADQAPLEARRLEAEQDVQEIRETTQFGTEPLNEERLEEIRRNVALTKMSPEGELSPAGREKISRALERIQALKKYTQERIQSHERNMHNTVQTAATNGQMLSMGAQAYSSYMKAGIEKMRGEIEKTRALMEYVNTVYNQLMQITLGLYNQGVDLSKDNVKTMESIAQANRAV